MVSCPSLQLSNGQIRCPTSSCPGNSCPFAKQCTFSCNTGYRLSGSQSSTCSAQGTWKYSSNTQPSCHTISCSSLQLSNVKIRCPTSSCFGNSCPFATQCTFSCNTGYRLSGSQSSRCSAQDTWQYSLNIQPRCDRVSCSKGSLQNGQISCDNQCHSTYCYYGRTCTYSCNTDFELTGSSSSTCSAQGTWNYATKPTCVYQWNKKSTCEYFIGKSFKFPSEAESFCQSRGSTLSILKTNAQLQYVQTLLAYGLYYIGFSKTAGSWSWADNSQLGRSFTQAEMPSYDCGTISTTTFAPVPCNIARKFVCERAVPRSSPCTLNSCQHGGTCTILGCSYKCSCLRQYVGLQCESKIMEINTAGSTLRIAKGETATLTIHVINRSNGRIACKVNKGTSVKKKWTVSRTTKTINYETVLQKSTDYDISCSIDTFIPPIVEAKAVSVYVTETAGVRVSRQKMTVLWNETLTNCSIACYTSGNPLPRAIWRRGSTIVSKKKYYDVYQSYPLRNKSCLNFMRPYFASGGEYKCTGTVNETIATTNVNIAVKGAPRSVTWNINTNVPSSGNSVKFLCQFNGIPKPYISWKFANGSELPKTSQYVVSTVSSSHEYEAKSELNVYGTLCKATAMQKFQCFATNSYTHAPVQSEVYNILHIAATSSPSSLTCSEAVSFCQSQGNNFPMATNTTHLKRIFVNSGLGNNMYFWMSSSSLQYFPLWQSNSHPKNCFRVYAYSKNDIRASYSNENNVARAVCELPPAPASSFNVSSDECDGSIIHVEWSLMAGASSLAHKVYYNSKYKVVLPSQTKTTIASLNTSQTYDISVMPMYEGCQLAWPLQTTTITLSKISLPTPQVTISLIGSTCNVQWNVNDAFHVGSYQVTFGAQIRNSRSNEPAQQHSVDKIDRKLTYYEIKNLTANTNYSVRVTALPFTKCSSKIPVAVSNFASGTCITPIQGPSQISLPTIPGSFGNGAKIRLPAVSERNGLISCYVLVVLKVTNSSQNVTRNITDIKQGSDVVRDGEQYIAVATRSESADITLGDGTSTCCDASQASGIGNCQNQTTSRQRRNAGNVIRGQNRPLQNEAKYQYYVMTATPGDTGTIYTASPISEPVTSAAPQPHSSSDLGLYIALAIVALLVIIAIILIVVYRRPIRRRLRRTKSGGARNGAARNVNQMRPVRRPSNREDSFESVSGDEDAMNQAGEKLNEFFISADSLLQTYKNKRAKEDRLFVDEFKKVLPELVTKAKVSTEYGKVAQQHRKNRFKNILPSDEARVVLSKSSDVMSDYINASYINGYSVPKKYIATQGPTESTCNDFWRMVTDKKCSIIVMLTQLTENHKEKCVKYWPEIGIQCQYGNCTVMTTNESAFGDVICRTFRVTMSRFNNPFEVKQLQYLGWPDHGIPHTTSSIFWLHKLAVGGHAVSGGPLLVHCSAGIGRTGTFIALDFLGEQMEAEGRVNVLAAVFQMRLNRTEMVQTLGQYVFVHKLIAELKAFGNTDVEAFEFTTQYDNLKIIDDSLHVSRLKIQFDRLDIVPPSLKETKAGRKAINKAFNVDSSVLPYDHSLAFVGMLSTDKEIPYLNGSSVPAYNFGFYYIVAQSPPECNLNTFWRCVTDNAIHCIVMLEEESSCSKYWLGQKAALFPEFNVEIVGLNKCHGYLERDMQVTRNSSTAQHHVKQFVFNSWKSVQPVPETSAFLEIISKVERFQAGATDVRGKRIIALVHSSDGSSRTGMFCGVANLLERLKNENKVDVMREVKNLRDLRPRMVGSVEQYEFCYEAVLQYVQSFDTYGNFKSSE
uniref:Tyrosine-protein phosphatase non-receptor type 20 n=1 Tax=Phallusia mammillata TaxID=59560 RepID=A0A6F9DPD4_9ASCI|nr:receptor-type tyrosine-protein phosphatase epsilon [Phallusia mammillata]